MRDEQKLDTLDAEISDIVARGRSASTGDEDLDALGRLAVGLCGLPRPEFRTALREQLLGGGTSMPAHAANTNVRDAHRRWPLSWLSGQGPYFVAGSSFGVAAGACCLSGFAAHVLGIASAGAARSFIHSTLPYFVALSLAGLVGWIAWLLREQGVSTKSVAGLIRQHGIAIGSSYAVVLAASMALANGI